MKEKESDEKFISDYKALNDLFIKESEHEKLINDLYSELENLYEILSEDET